MQTIGEWNGAASEPLALTTSRIYRPGKSDGTAGPRQYLRSANGTNVTVVSAEPGSSEADLSSDVQDPPIAAVPSAYTEKDSVRSSNFNYFI